MLSCYPDVAAFDLLPPGPFWTIVCVSFRTGGQTARTSSFALSLIGVLEAMSIITHAPTRLKLLYVLLMLHKSAFRRGRAHPD